MKRLDPTEAQMKAAVGAAVRQAREDAGLTREQFVAQLPFRVTVATLLNWELGHRGISYLRLVELAHALDETAPSLLERAIKNLELGPTHDCPPSAPAVSHHDLLLIVADYATRVTTMLLALNQSAMANNRHAVEDYAKRTASIRLHLSRIRRCACGNRR
jgi:transcriptional regulator with XRE-family HTH domain